MLLEGRVLAVVEDDPIMGESLVQRLSLEGARVTWCRTGKQASSTLAKLRPEAIVCDIRLPDLDGEKLFHESVQSDSAAPFIFITGYGDIDQAVRLMRSGAVDYVTKPFEMEGFLERLVDLLPQRSDDTSAVLGVSSAMRSVQRLLDRIAKVKPTVLITGETGTGKEVAARYLHAMSDLRSKPFIAVNCAAIPSELLESELFGHEKGSFTGASQRHLGYAERAGQGILFLDEIGELRPGLQAKLLRLLEQRTFQRVGGEQVLPFTARLVAATNADLKAAVVAGRFRNDLLFRLDVLGVKLPPLRDRVDDIPWLLDRFFVELAAIMDTSMKGISAHTEQLALEYDWPGNVRELRNRVERAVALGLGTWMMPGDLFPDLLAVQQQPTAFGSLEDARNRAERQHILRALALTGGEIASAAKTLGIGRTTLWEKMQRLGMKDN